MIKLFFCLLLLAATFQKDVELLSPSNKAIYSFFGFEFNGTVLNGEIAAMQLRTR